MSDAPPQGPPEPPESPPARPSEPPPDLPKPPDDPAPWGLAGSIIMVMLALGSQLVLGPLIGAFAGLVLAVASPDLADRPEELVEAATQITILPLALAYSLVTLGLIYASVVVRHHRLLLKSLGLVRPAIGMLLASAALGCVVSMAGLRIMTMFPYEGPLESLGPLTKLANSGSLGMFIWLLLALVMAPIVEEILYRGYAYAGARRRLGAAGAGLAVTTVFLVLHLFETGMYWPALVGIGMLAILLVILRERTGNLTYCIVCHLGYNATLASVALFGG